MQVMEKQLTNNGPLKESADKHSIYTPGGHMKEAVPHTARQRRDAERHPGPV